MTENIENGLYPQPSTSEAPARARILEPELARKCTDELRGFRNASIDKGSAMVEIARLVGQSTECAGDRRANTINAYFRILDSDERGRTTLDSDSRSLGFEGNELEKGGEDFSDESEVREDEQGADKVKERRRRRQSREQKRKRREDSSGSEEVPTKRLDTSKLPWEIDELTSPVPLAPTLRETQELLRLFAGDRRAVKMSIVTAARHLEFPDGEWDNIIRGRAVDLNKVLTNMVVLGGEPKHIEHVAGLKLQVESSLPVRKVQTLGDWTLAWGKVSAAIAFVFPHRRDELQTYADHITELFGAINPLYHSRIVLYDQLVRVRVSCRQDMLLSDLSRFDDLRTMHITSIGVGVTATSHEPDSYNANSIRKLPAKVFEPCRRFNLGKCPNSTRSCRYQHVCASCHQSGHVEAKCSKATSSH
jgi:hypothetical protein